MNNIENDSNEKSKKHEILKYDKNVDYTEKIISVARITDLVKEVDPTVQLDEEVPEILMSLIDDFVDKVINGSCLLSKHRKNSTVGISDVQLYLKQICNIWIPGFGTEQLIPYKSAKITDEHKQRLALIRKELKKN